MDAPLCVADKRTNEQSQFPHVGVHDISSAQARSRTTVPDKFDPYREALVVETTTTWPAESGSLDEAERAEIEQKLHADASACTNLEYIRVPTGFCRRITATPEDIARVAG
jgi:uncharacterized membrane protein YebE (DUF533 family)